MRSIISNEKECFVCGTTENLHKHHIFYGTANRRKAEQDGCWCYLCARHHNASALGVHFNTPFDKTLKAECQEAWEARFGDREAFIKRFGRSWL